MEFPRIGSVLMALTLTWTLAPWVSRFCRRGGTFLFTRVFAPLFRFGWRRIGGEKEEEEEERERGGEEAGGPQEEEGGSGSEVQRRPSPPPGPGEPTAVVALVANSEFTDEFYCEYDSTWEESEEEGEESDETRGRSQEQVRRHVGVADVPSRHQNRFRRFENAARDMSNYRHDYPSSPRIWTLNPRSSSYDQEDRPNLDFYLGRRPSSPDGVFIHDFHERWAGNYRLLEDVHTYIQWLFPLQEGGVNPEAVPLSKREVQDFCDSAEAKANLLRSYQLMLEFYGIQMGDAHSGSVHRSPDWRARFQNLNSRTHNSLRITRILKCLGTLGFAHFQAPLVDFFLTETLVNGELPNVRDSVLNYFLFAVLDRKQRRRLVEFAYANYEPKEEFVWCPRRVQRMWSKSGSIYRLESEF